MRATEMFEANLRHAIRHGESVTIGGGIFRPDELTAVLAAIETAKASPSELGPYLLSPESQSDLADLAVSESPHAADLARNIGDWLAGRDHAPPAVIASARLLDSNAALSRGAHAKCAESLARADSRLASILMAATLTGERATALKDSRYPPARCAFAYLEAFRQSGDASTLECALDAVIELARLAADADSEVRELKASLETARAERDAYRKQRDEQGERATEAEALAASRLAEAVEFRTSTLGEAGRADKAERQLAEYRTLMSALPAGLALAYPVALPLLRAYLADAEGRGPSRRNLSVDGHESESPNAALDSSGRFPPFHIFDSDAQDWLPGSYPTREAAEQALARMESAK